MSEQNNENRKAEVGQRIPVTLGNIAPLALKPFHAGQLALVCEGGGQRGIFTAGVQIGRASCRERVYSGV